MSRDQRDDKGKVIQLRAINDLIISGDVTGVELRISVICFATGMQPLLITSTYLPIGLEQEDILSEDVAEDRVDDLPHDHVLRNYKTYT